jgi:hypothetical protein
MWAGLSTKWPDKTGEMPCAPTPPAATQTRVLTGPRGEPNRYFRLRLSTP